MISLKKAYKKYSCKNNLYIFKQIVEKQKEDEILQYIILPSSVHEVLILPDTGNIDVERTKELVASINQAELPIADKLSDNVYHYEASAGIFEVADKYLARKAYIS